MLGGVICWKNYKPQTLFKKERLEKPNNNKGDKNKGTKRNASLWNQQLLERVNAA